MHPVASVNDEATGLRLDEGVGSLLAAMITATDAAGVALFTVDPDGRPQYFHSNALIDEQLAAAFKTVLPELRAAPAQRWYLAPSGTSVMMTRVDGSSDGLILALAFGPLAPAIHKAVDRTCRLMLPLLIASLHICRSAARLSRNRLSSDYALHAINVGIFMLKQDGAVLFSNQAASRFLATGEGLQASGTFLKAEYLTDGVKLHAALAHVTDSGNASGKTSALLTFRRKSRPPLVASLISSGQDRLDRNPAEAILYVIDPGSEAANGIPAICRLHGLSPVETSLVCYLVRGDVIAEAAHKMGIKELTARSYLKQIFIKTNTRRQTELVIQMLTSLIPLTENGSQETMPVGSTDGLDFRKNAKH